MQGFRVLDMWVLSRQSLLPFGKTEKIPWIKLSWGLFGFASALELP
jgi:hypothetical protein